MLKVNFDGSCEPRNPNGNLGMGFIGVHDDGVAEFVGKHRVRFGECGFNQTSNNVAEYLAFIFALNQVLLKIDAKIPVVFQGDSQLVVKQMNKEWRIKDGVYAPYAYIAYHLYHSSIEAGRKFGIKWVAREKNSLADDLSK